MWLCTEYSETSKCFENLSQGHKLVRINETEATVELREIFSDGNELVFARNAVAIENPEKLRDPMQTAEILKSFILLSKTDLQQITDAEIKRRSKMTNHTIENSKEENLDLRSALDEANNTVHEKRRLFSR